jgi:hypothetical protein
MFAAVVFSFSAFVASSAAAVSVNIALAAKPLHPPVMVTSTRILQAYLLPGRCMYRLKAALYETLIQIAASCSKFSSTKYLFICIGPIPESLWSMLAVE